MPEMESERGASAATPVAGGLVVVGGADWEPDELYDEKSGCWFQLPSYRMTLAEASVVTLPVAVSL